MGSQAENPLPICAPALHASRCVLRESEWRQWNRSHAIHHDHCGTVTVPLSPHSIEVTVTVRQYRPRPNCQCQCVLCSASWSHQPCNATYHHAIVAMPCDSSLLQQVGCAATTSSSCAASILSDDYAQCAVTPREARDCLLRNNQN
jgi:hypothetical protein